MISKFVKENTLEFPSILEARGVLESLKNTNKALLKKKPNFIEDYSFLLGANYCVLQYTITDLDNNTFP
jgi:hypothetical protein